MRFKNAILVLAVLLPLVALDASPAAAATPTVVSFNPTSAVAGESIVISGDGFDTATDVSFNGTAAPFNIDSAIQITATVPDGASTGPVSVTNVDGSSASSTNFTVLPPAPHVVDFAPKAGAIGSLVTILGTDLVAVDTVEFNGTLATFDVVDATEITAQVPAGATTGPIKVTSGGGADAAAANFSVIKKPKITGFSPRKAPVGAFVSIVGTRQLKWVTRVWFGSEGANFSHISSTKLRAKVPRGFKDAHIRVTNKAGSDMSNDVFHQRRIRVRARVTLALRKHLRASGTVRAGKQVCQGQRVVLIQHDASGHWKTIKTVRAGSRGGYAVSLPDKTGKYRAIVKTKQTLTVHCLPDVSPSATHADSSGGGGTGGGGGGGTSCTPGYSPCLTYHGGADYDCYGGSGDGPYYTKPGVVYSVTGSDPYGLDADNDGKGCE